MSVFPGSFTGRQFPLGPVKFRPVQLFQNPRFIVTIDGHNYIGTSFRYTQSAHGSTDEAEVVLPVDGKSNMPFNPNFNGIYPDWTKSIERSDTLGNADQPVSCQIWSGQPTDLSSFSARNKSGLVLRFSGIVDMYSVRLRDNRTTFTCRSLAFPLTSTKITTPFPREATTTTVAFIQQQAKRFGLKVATPQLGGEPLLMIDVLGGEFISGVRGWYIWDLMLRCAQADDVDIWVDRTGVLHYEAASLISRTKIYYIWGQNCKEVEGTHSPQFSKNIQVQVHSYTKRTRTISAVRVSTNPDGGMHVSTYTRKVSTTPVFGTTTSLVTSISPNGTVTTSESSVSGGSAGATTGSLSEAGKQKYVFFVRNKTLAQCQDLAQKYWRQISIHEYAVRLDAPVTVGDLPLMDVTASIVLSGHPMARFNGKYWPREIIESFDVKTGWSWEIDCLNHPLAQGGV